MKKNIIVLSIGIFLVAGMSGMALADEYNTLASVGVDYWMPSLDAKVKSSDLAIIGTEVDLIDDLGLDDSENAPNFKGSIDLPFLPELYVSYFKIDASATKNITRQVVYKGYTYTATTNLSSQYDITHYEGLLIFNILNSEFTRLGFLAGAKYFEVETQLKDNTTGITRSDSIDGPVPVVGAIASIKLPAKFKIECLARGLSLEVNDIDAALYDIDGALNYDFNRFLRATLGYRYFVIDAEDSGNDDMVDIKFTGPYIGITGSF